MLPMGGDTRCIAMLGLRVLGSSGLRLTLTNMSVLLVAGAAMCPPGFAATQTLCVHDIEPPSALSVRSKPDDASPVIARFPAKACGITQTGRCEGVWCQMALGGQSGWVNTRYIGVYELPDGYQSTAKPLPPKLSTAARARTLPDRSPADQKSATKVMVRKATPPRIAAEALRPKTATVVETMKPERKLLVRKAAPRYATTRYETDRYARRQSIANWSSGSRPKWSFAAIVQSLLGGSKRPRVVAAARNDRDYDLEQRACVVRVERNDTLRVRSGPGVDNDAIASIPPGACGVERTGNCKGHWCRIAWAGRIGWVNNHYLE